MECAFAFFLITLAVCFGLLMLLFNYYRPALADEGLKLVAKRFGGSLFGRTWLRSASVAFKYGAVSALLRMHGRASGMWLELCVYTSNPGFRVEVYPEEDEAMRSLAFDRSLRPWKAIEKGRYEYLIAAESPNDVTHFLSDGVRQQLEQLFALANSSALTVVVEPQQLTVRKRWASQLKNADLFLELVNAALRLHDQIQLSRAEGIQFSESTNAKAIEHEKCAICGEAIEDGYVTCRQCQAPHHLDCWRYNGTCGMFACKSVKYEVALRKERR